MPSIRVATIPLIAPASFTLSALTCASAMMKPTTVPISPSSTSVLAICRTNTMRENRRSSSARVAEPGLDAVAAIR
jgi:hypothetical protein